MLSDFADPSLEVLQHHFNHTVKPQTARKVALLCTTAGLHQDNQTPAGRIRTHEGITPKQL